MNPNEQKAAELLASWQKWHGNIEQWIRKVIVPKLATPDHEAALAACERLCNSKRGGLFPESQVCFDIGRRSLDAKKPKERWTVDGSAGPARWVVWHAEDGHSTARAWFSLERDARDYAAEQNAKEAPRV